MNGITTAAELKARADELFAARQRAGGQMSRDAQRQRVYDAEHVLQRFYDVASEIGHRQLSLKGINLTLPPEAKFASIESIQAYVDRVRALPALAHHSRAAIPVTVRARQGERKAHYQNRNATIAIPDTRGSWAMRELVVLHELAHHFAWGDGHGPRFAAAFLDLVGTVLGPETELALRITYDDHEVNYRPKTLQEVP